MNSSEPISSFVKPRATRARISRSRSVRVRRPAATAAAPPSEAGRAATNVSIRRRVIEGSMSASPWATTRTAEAISSGSASLSKKPLAPAAKASYTYSSRSNVVRMSTCTFSSAASSRMARVASMPFIRGIRMSMSTTSGCSRDASSTASWPSRASPTTSMPSYDISMSLKPLRTRS